MIEIKCFCGKSAKNFQKNIGPHFFNDECCEAAGFDHLGNKKPEEKPIKKPEEKPEVIEIKEEKPEVIPEKVVVNSNKRRKRK